MKIVLDIPPRNERFPGSDLAREELEFARAIVAFQVQTGRRFPTWSEVLRIARSLGYRRCEAPTEIQP